MSRTGVNKVSGLAGKRVSGFSGLRNPHTRTPAHPHTDRSFTLIEVLVAVTILAVGMIGVIRAYITLINGIDASRFTVEASYLLKNKMADVEKSALENLGVPAGMQSGVFSGAHSNFKWEVDVMDFKKEEVKAKEAESVPVETLSKVRVSVMTSGASALKRADIYTYLEGYTE